MAKSLVFDLETLDHKPSAIILDISAVLVDLGDKDITFKSLLAGPVFNVKLDARTQVGRTVGKDTLKWWESQPVEVKKVLLPSKNDVHITAALESFKQWLADNDFDFKNDLAYCRGTSFDFAIMSDVCDKVCNTWDMGYSMFPCSFWNQRDTRTAVAHAMAFPTLKKLPVPVGTFDGFIKHNSVHDVCKDAMMLMLSHQYSLGNIDVPLERFDLI